MSETPTSPGNAIKETVKRVSAELLTLGLRPGGAVIVHASLRALGHVSGGPETIILGLLQALGPRGTLLMPALTFETVTPIRPIFDILHTPSDVGVLTEYFRNRPGTRRSLHPTHSVCGVGPLTDALLGGHYRDRTPCGPNSPFHLLPKYEGQILMLGCGLRPNTSMHAVEEMVQPPYLFGNPLAYRLRLADGKEVERVYRQHGFDGWIQRYERAGSLMGDEELHVGRVLAAEVHLLEASAFWREALEALNLDPLHFVDRVKGSRQVS